MGSGDAGDVGQVLHLGQRALVRRLRAAGHGGRARGRAGRAVRAQARQEERARAHCHRVRVLRVAGGHHALALLRVLLGAQGRAVCATQGVSHSREANQHHTNAHMLYAPHRYVTSPTRFPYSSTLVFVYTSTRTDTIRDVPDTESVVSILLMTMDHEPRVLVHSPAFYYSYNRTTLYKTYNYITSPTITAGCLYCLCRSDTSLN